MKTFFIISLILALNQYASYQNNTLDDSDSNVTLEGEYKKDLDYLKEVEKENILTACLIVTRNNIVKNKLKIDTILESTKFNKGKLFDKIVVSMVKNCKNNLDIEKARKVLSVENITELTLPENDLEFYDERVASYEPVLHEDELNLLKLGAKLNKPQKVNGQTSKESKLNVKDDLVTTVLSVFEVTQTRYIIYGMLSSFFTCLVLWYLIGNFFQRKNKVIKFEPTLLINKKKN